MEFTLSHPYLTFMLAIVSIVTVGLVLRCLFKAFGGGYLPRKHCDGCECEPQSDEDDDA